MRAEWKGRAAFAEVAEALNVSTDTIMAVNLKGDDYLALYTPNDDDVIWSVGLRRNRVGIMEPCTVPVEHPGMWEKILEALEEK